ncbi:ATP-dependent endonuclease of the OLD family [Tenacibaculum litoreum]|uniref:ATP-dependent nuclease n=1 Tax=Tenacibaculum litoreum TaxID=321269 RepID=UPI0038945C31
MNSPYISRVQIENFRNFKKIDVNLTHKQVIIGENNVGKTNLLRAIQLILDRNLSDLDRELNVSDFHDSIEDPIGNGEVIKIAIEIQNYQHNRQLIAQFQDAVISTTPPTLRFTYKYFPLRDEGGEILSYQYQIYKGATEDKFFRSEDRNFLNIKVIGALRDVERELSANKRSPLFKLVKQYNIDQEELDEISEAMQEAAEDILELDEIKDIKNIIEDKFKTLAGLQHDNKINLRPYDIDTERLLYTMQVYMGLKERPVSELSLGLANILYVAMMMLLLRDKTVPRILKKEAYDDLITKENGVLISGNYTVNEKGNNYIQNDNIDTEIKKQLYEFFDQHNHQLHSVTILAVEEPEAHLHPVLQRLIYREVLHKSETSVIFTTHSPYITAVAPLDTMVHCRHEKGETKVFSTSSLVIDPKDKTDIERYLDAKRGEMYFGKGVLLVEGITEEYIVPRTAELTGTYLDDLGIVVCNVHSTNFKPYVQILEALGIPWCLITDGDYYNLEIKTEDNKEKRIRHYHQIWQEGTPQHFRGLELMNKMNVELGLITEAEIQLDNFPSQFNLHKNKGCFVGFYTLEIDTMIKGGAQGKEILKTVYSEVRPGGEKQQKNFDDELDANNFWTALSKIEKNVSKGRFAQRFASHITLDLVPDYIQNAITEIIKKVTSTHE